MNPHAFPEPVPPRTPTRARRPAAAPRLCAALLLAASLPAQDAASSAGHARTRELAGLGRLPTAVEVAVADIVNYHEHRLPPPRAGRAVAVDLRFGAVAVRPGGEAVLQIGLRTAPAGDRGELPPLNLVLVVDCSGSMAAAGKLGHVQQALRALAARLRPEDRIALATYADEARLLAPSRPLGAGRWLDEAIEGLRPGGSTNLHGGLLLGLREAARQRLPRGSNRAILLTDGIANRGETDPGAILREASVWTAEDIDLTTIGVGQELNTALLDRLARGGRGLFHFVADASDIEKVFVDEVEGLLAPAARRAELRLRLPRELHVEHVWGHEWHGEDGELVVPLPDMNRGMTAVVLARCRCDGRARPGERLEAAAELLARSASDGRAIAERAEAIIDVRERAGDPLADVEVRKNQTIAVLAQALHDMARQAEERRWAAAERTLRAALQVARERYGHGDDADVAAVLAMAEAHERTLRRHVDRFRDLE